MANAQKTTPNTLTPDQNDLELLALLRQNYPGYDNYTLSDLKKLGPATTIGLTTMINDLGDWRMFIPQAITKQHGDEAPRLYMIAMFERLAQIRGIDKPKFDNTYVSSLRSVIGNELKLTTEERNSLVLDRPVELKLTTGASITTLPSLAMLHEISMQAASSKLADLTERPKDGEPFFGSKGGIIALPNSLIDALKQENPKFAKRLETLRGKAVLIVDPQTVYLAGQIGQIRGKDNVHDWSMNTSAAPSTPGFCENVAQIERDLTNRTLGDVRVDEAQIAGAVRASKVCPVSLGGMTPPPTANSNTPRVRGASSAAL